MKSDLMELIVHEEMLPVPKKGSNSQDGLKPSRRFAQNDQGCAKKPSDCFIFNLDGEFLENTALWEFQGKGKWEN